MAPQILVICIEEPPGFLLHKYSEIIICRIKDLNVDGTNVKMFRKYIGRISYNPGSGKAFKM